MRHVRSGDGIPSNDRLVNTWEAPENGAFSGRKVFKNSFTILCSEGVHKVCLQTRESDMHASPRRTRI